MADIVIFGVATVFAVWVVFLGGAEWLEGTIKSAFLLNANAASWHATGIKAYVAIMWVGSLLWFLVL